MMTVPKDKTMLMGTIVTVRTEFVRREFVRRNSTWERQNVKPRAGWVVGFRTLRDTKNTSPYNEYADYDPFDYEVTGTKPCVLVSYWYTDNPVRVPLDGFDIGGTPHARQTCGETTIGSGWVEDATH